MVFTLSELAVESSSQAAKQDVVYASLGFVRNLREPGGRNTLQFYSLLLALFEEVKLLSQSGQFSVLVH